jgi:pimeloyl-ACP methyl ester carboxylesterase
MGLGQLALLGLLMLLVPVPSGAASCTSATAACTEWIDAPGRTGRLLIYRTHPIEIRNPDIAGALIVVHGAGRDADNYFRHALAAAFLAGALDNTIILSPRFAANNGDGCRDTFADRELKWQCNGPGRWTAGGTAADETTFTSFDIVDEMLRRLARREVFPNLRAIVVAGHSAGGQFVSRYQMANEVHERLGVPVTYVISNPSSYAYLDRLRPSTSAIPPTIAAGAPGFSPPVAANSPAPFVEFTDRQNCSTYDKWPYGLRERPGYAGKISDDQLKKQLAARPATYLLGALDILPLFNFDGSCPAMAQGPTRLARGVAYAKYVNERYGARHAMVIVPACGHNARCMFTDNATLPLIFLGACPSNRL